MARRDLVSGRQQLAPLQRNAEEEVGMGKVVQVEGRRRWDSARCTEAVGQAAVEGMHEDPEGADGCRKGRIAAEVRPAVAHRPTVCRVPVQAQKPASAPRLA